MMHAKTGVLTNIQNIVSIKYIKETRHVGSCNIRYRFSFLILL